MLYYDACVRLLMLLLLLLELV